MNFNGEKYELKYKHIMIFGYIIANDFLNLAVEMLQSDKWDYATWTDYEALESNNSDFTLFLENI